MRSSRAKSSPGASRNSFSSQQPQPRLEAHGKDERNQEKIHEKSVANSVGCSLLPEFRQAPSGEYRLKSGSIRFPTLCSFPPHCIWAKWVVWRRIRAENIFVYTRTGHPTVTIGTARPFAHGGSRLFQFDRSGKFVREIGKDTYAFMYAAQVRVDPSDNLWVVDQMTSMVIKFDPQGRVAMLLGRKAENVNVPGACSKGRRRRTTDEPVRRPDRRSLGRGLGTYLSPTALGMRASQSLIKSANS